MARPLQRSRLSSFLLRVYQRVTRRLTRRGQYLLWTAFTLAILGLDTRRTQVFFLFALASSMLLVAVAFAMRPPPKASIECRAPRRATALTPVMFTVHISSHAGARRDLQLALSPPPHLESGIVFTPGEHLFALEPDVPAEISAEFRAVRRGRYVLPGAALAATDPLQLATTRPVKAPDQTVLVYPRFYSMEEFRVPLGRRYQPGGIPLSSNTGDAIEFIGTREYREGDPVKNIHWRSSARRGQPVVKEFQEEYFCRIALILDTFLPPSPAPGEELAFEAAISVLASIADYFSRSDYIVDILAAGPDIYEVSAGRSLAYLENILDVLACLEPCHNTPFATIGPALFEKLARITTVVAVLQDWDPARQEFLRRVRMMGAAVQAIVVREGATTHPWQHAGPDLEEITVLSPADVERLLLAARGPNGSIARGGKEQR